jgi:integrase
MPTLTQIAVKNYRPKKVRREIPDSTPGLYLVVQPSGRKSWALRFRRPDGRPCKMTLGPVDDATVEPSDESTEGAPLTLLQAREVANKIARERARGVDVITARKTEELRKQTAAKVSASNTFGAAVHAFFVDYQTKKWQTRPRHWRSDAATLGLRYPPRSDPVAVQPEIIRGGLAEAWADKPITSIDGYAVHTVVDEARKLGSNGRARKLHSALSILFSWLQRDKNMHITINPVAGVWRPGPPPSREHALKPAEIVIFWKACDSVGGAFGALWKTLLLTGCRLREVSGMTRAELGNNGVWEIPSSRIKNHLTFMVPLPQQAIDVIASVPAIKGEAGLIFTTNGKTPISGFSKAKKNLDAEMAKIAGRPITPWRVHDLRRTCSTIMNESPDDGGLGIAPHIVEAVLNHISGGAKAGVAGTYNKAKYLSEKRVSLQRWANHIEGVVAGRKANVTPLRRKQRS